MEKSKNIAARIFGIRNQDRLRQLPIDFIDAAGVVPLSHGYVLDTA